GSLAELDADTRTQVLDRYLAGELPPPATAPATAPATDPATDPGADPKAELAALFRTYFERGFRLAVTGDQHAKVDHLVHCGPSMGAFNQVVAGTELHPWQARTVAAIADVLMEGAAAHITARLHTFR
ncbi:[acyl-carrier-protein] S-malonyltransferase, partial [Kitasatospora sp. NPDC008050]